jgi:hypothetical protein
MPFFLAKEDGGWAAGKPDGANNGLWGEWSKVLG